MKEIKIKYSEYELPKNPHVYNKIGKFICEYFGFSLYREDKTFTLAVENPDLFLSNNKNFAVKNEFLENENLREKKATKTGEENLIFDIQKWQYRFSGKEECEIVVSAQRRKLSQTDALYNAMPDKWQIFFPLFTYLIFSALFVVAYVIFSDYPNPVPFWSAIGKYIQTTVSWSLLFLMVGLFIWSTFIYRGSVILKSYLSAASVLLAVILPILWASVSARPAEFGGQPNEHILYLNYLRNYFSTSSLVLIGLVPWITLFLKHFGLNLLPAILSLLFKSK